jgi:hypothetical protein
MVEERNETGHKTLECIIIWLWDIRSGTRGVKRRKNVWEYGYGV